MDDPYKFGFVGIVNVPDPYAGLGIATTGVVEGARIGKIAEYPDVRRGIGVQAIAAPRDSQFLVYFGRSARHWQHSR